MARIALTKFENTLNKRFPDRAAVLDDEGFERLMELNEAEFAATAEFLDTIKAEDEGQGSDEGDFVQTKASSKAPPNTKHRVKKAAARSSIDSRGSKTPSVEPEDDIGDVSTTSTTRRSSRKSKPIARKPQPVIEEKSEEEVSEQESSEESDVVQTPLDGQDEETDDTM